MHLRILGFGREAAFLAMIRYSSFCMSSSVVCKISDKSACVDDEIFLNWGDMSSLPATL